jgi:alpha-amylase
VDGFRFDAVGHLVENGPNAWDNQPENNAILARIQGLTNSYANRYIVCEGPAAPLMYAQSNSCNSAFAFRHNGNIIAAAKGDGFALQEVAQYPSPGAGKSPQRMATLLSNHDAFAGVRVWDQLAGNQGAYKVAAALLLLQPGIPFVYYGEEIGLAGAANLSGDWQLRTPMSWSANTTHAGFSTVAPFRALSANAASHNVAAQEANANGILAHYKALLALRGSRASIARGSYERPSTSGSVLSFVRALDGERTGVAVNTSSGSVLVTIQGLSPNKRYSLIYSATASSNTPLPQAAAQGFAADASGEATFSLPAHAVWVWTE